MDSIDKNDDLELLAALMDGKLSRMERARVMKLLADSDEALEVFASAARDERLAQVPSPSVTPIWRRWKVSVPIAAAASITLTVLPRLVGMGGDTAFASDFAVRLTRQPAWSGAAVRSGWEQHGWSETRGARPRMSASSPTDSAESRRAFRLGVRTVDLQVALRSGDTAVADRVTDDITQTLRDVDFAGRVSTAYSNFKSNIGTVPFNESIHRASSIEGDLRDILHSQARSFENGQWMGAAHLAARAHFASFFESRNGLRFIRSALAAGKLDDEETKAFHYVESAVTRSTDDTTLDDVQEVLREAIQSRGG